MIIIDRSVINKIIEISRKDSPIEACGYLGARGGIISEIFPMTNADKSPEHFSFIPKEQFGVMKEARARNIELSVVWHSHPATPARMSAEDIRLAADTGIFYMIYSVAENDLGCFEIDGAGGVKEINFEVVEG